MRFVHCRIFCLFILLIFQFHGEAQRVFRVSANFDSIHFEQFARKIELQVPVHFYYNPRQLDSLVISVKANDEELPVVLDRVLAGSAFHFTLDSTSNVYVFNRQFSVQSALSKDFFASRPAAPDTVVADVTAVPQNQRKLQTGVENKLFDVGTASAGSTKSTAIITGYVRNAASGEAVAGASVYMDNSDAGTITDQQGYYSVTLPRGRHTLRISGTGMKSTRRDVIVHSDGSLNIEMVDDIPTLKTAMVVAEKNSNVKRLQMGVERLNIKTIKSVPALLGEADVLRVVLTLPGVTSVGEASTGFNVRGGSADQNLILYNDATIYNPSHLFGFFTAFNPDVVKGVELYKSSIPEKYGGRLSSVLDVTTRTGNTKKWTGIAGIGVLTSKITVEGPLDKDKTSVIIGGRTTYSNWVLKNIKNEDYRNSKASFYDLDFHLSHAANPKNNFYLSAYRSGDEFRLNNDTLYRYSNRNVVAKWKHILSNKMFMTITGGLDHYQYTVTGDEKSIRSFKLGFRIDQLHASADFNFSPNNTHNFNFGLSSVRYRLHPGSLEPNGIGSLVTPDIVPVEQGLESAIYFGDRYRVSSRLSLNAGLRYSLFNYLGPHSVYTYVDGLPKDESTLRDSTVYGSGKVIKSYHGPEIRLSSRYSITESSSLKLSFNTLRQYIHLLSNTSAISPTDIWKLSDPNIQPQQGWQASLGIYRDFKSGLIETSVEVYYKKLQHYLDYKSGAQLVTNQHIETDVLSTEGHAYGAELLFRKNSGKLNGWISYTYSRTLLRMNDSTEGPLINGGHYYPANFDKPHVVNCIGNYRFSHRYSVSLNGVYSTGRPITLPIAIYNLAGAQRVYYSERNQYRIPDYFRVDFSVNIEGNHKIKKLTHNSWALGVYNVTGRKNPYSVFFVSENGRIKGYKLSVIGTAIPFITYNLRF